VIKLGKMRWSGHVAYIGERRSAYRVLAGKPEGKRPLRTSRPRLKYNIKMELREILWGLRGLICLWTGVSGGAFVKGGTESLG